MSLDTHLTISRFELLARTEEAALEGGGVVGRFSKTPLVITNVARICEEFANHPETDAGILRFTKKYAPLVNDAKPDGTFRFELYEWRAWRTTFRNNWKSVVEAPAEYDRGEKTWSFPKGSRLIFSRRGNALEQRRLLGLINLCFGGLPWERIRICPAPGCERPFFIATHLKQTYCGDQLCVEWGKRKLKLEYWNRNKGRFLAQRRRKTDRRGAS
jgi:hypothetical protein